MPLNLGIYKRFTEDLQPVQKAYNPVYSPYKLLYKSLV